MVIKSWDLQTHESTWEQLECQMNNLTLQQDKAANYWLHPREYFVWDHKYINIYIILVLDILHQLSKGVVTNLVSWITIIVSILRRLAKKQGQRMRTTTKEKKKKGGLGRGAAQKVPN